MAKAKELEVMEDVELDAISPVESEFNREDLNGLRDKLNEVIAHLNSA